MQDGRDMDGKGVYVICLVATDWNSYTSLLEGSDDFKLQFKWN